MILRWKAGRQEKASQEDNWLKAPWVIVFSRQTKLCRVCNFQPWAYLRGPSNMRTDMADALPELSWTSLR
jgi:hypothetical protein